MDKQVAIKFEDWPSRSPTYYTLRASSCFISLGPSGHLACLQDNQGKSSSLQLHHEQDTSTGLSRVTFSVQEVLALVEASKPQGFAKLYSFTTEGRFSCLVMEMLGFSLEDRLQSCGGKFTAATCATRLKWLG